MTKEAKAKTEVQEAPETPGMPEETTQEPRIYIGPSIREVVQTAAIFKNDITPNLKTAIADLPAIGELLVPLSRLVEKQKELAVEGSALQRFYALASTYVLTKKQ